jgi:hypothetical protein
MALVVWISKGGGEESYFGDETLRMNQIFGATHDMIVSLALLTPTVNGSSMAG